MDLWMSPYCTLYQGAKNSWLMPLFKSLFGLRVTTVAAYVSRSVITLIPVRSCCHGHILKGISSVLTDIVGLPERSRGLFRHQYQISRFPK
jgi:hypothetical protein